MHSHSSQSALTIAAALMRSVWGGVVLGFGVLRGEMAFEIAIQNWVNGIFRGLEALLAQYRAGELPPVVVPRVVADETPAPHCVRAPDAAAWLEASPRAKRRIVAQMGDGTGGFAIQAGYKIRLDREVAKGRLALTTYGSADLIDGINLRAFYGPIFIKIGVVPA